MKYTPPYRSCVIENLGNEEIVLSLVMKGAKKSAKDSNGKTPIDLLGELDIDQ